MSKILNQDNPKDREVLRRLFMVKKTEGEMMKLRGFDLNNIYMVNTENNFMGPLSLAALQEPDHPFAKVLQWRKETGLFATRRDFSSLYRNTDNTRQVLVLYLDNKPGKQVAKQEFNPVRLFIKTGQIHHIIVITETGLSSANMSAIKDQMPNYNIEVFTDQELAFNHLKHVLSPISITHIPGDQVSAWSAKEGLSREQLPMILNMDSLTKFYGARPLDVMQYVILGTGTDTAGYYRVVRQTPSVRRS